MIGDLLAGAGDLLRGFAFWRRRPGAMALGLVPAAIVALVVLAALVALGATVGDLVTWITPFADAWDAGWAIALRVAVGAALFGATILLAAVTFTALTLTVGDPFYERIWRAVETEEGGAVPEEGPGFWRAAATGAALVGFGVLNAGLVLLIGFVPVVGSVTAAVLGVVLSGRLLARELTGRAFDARGLRAAERRRMLRGHGARMLGFGVATQLLFLLPGGAVLTMPAAVAGSTLLARRVLDGSEASARP
ncbi:EI24 domain-containing protein [Agromyces sp. SYSU T00194]|uniref:EI24 domain-containing protein n=1 Tax=Agromyces chitinivorans TaxID=3158560 RepID=UPI00339839B9